MKDIIINGIENEEILVDDMYGFWSDNEQLFYVSFNENTHSIDVVEISSKQNSSWAYIVKVGAELESELEAIDHLSNSGLRPVNVEINIKW